VWFLGFSHFLAGDLERALPYFERHGKQRDKLQGGQGRYWHARTLQGLGRSAEATGEYRTLVGAWPFSWYSQLARARLREQGVALGPFGDRATTGARVPPVAAEPDPALARDPLIRGVDELIAAGLGVHAAVELRRGEQTFSRRHDRGRANAMLLDRYCAAGDYNRPWMLAVVRGAQALDEPPEGDARIWWQNAYPLAYRELVDRHREAGGNPPYYLYAIMQKESGFDPHTVSYADALGLLQMIPPTTRRVVKALGMTYTDDLLFDPESNIKLGSWYIGHLFHKFGGQVPIAASSYNAGPGATMRWLRANGHRPIDEYQELVSHDQARGYGMKVTETYARYLYLYAGEVYDLPLAVDADFRRDEITY
jgi:soluble lytic murein transglycosylase